MVNAPWPQTTARRRGARSAPPGYPLPTLPAGRNCSLCRSALDSSLIEINPDWSVHYRRLRNRLEQQRVTVVEARATSSPACTQDGGRWRGQRTVLRRGEFAEPHFVRRGPASVFGRPLDQTQESRETAESERNLPFCRQCQPALARLTARGVPQGGAFAQAHRGGGKPKAAALPGPLGAEFKEFGSRRPGQASADAAGPKSARRARGPHQRCIGPNRPFLKTFVSPRSGSDVAPV